MPSRITLPACAAALWAGLLLGERLPPAIAGVLVVVVGCVPVVGLARRSGRRSRSARLMARVRARRAPRQPTERERVLLAAGFGAAKAPVPTSAARALWCVLAFALLGLGWGGVRLQPTDLGPLAGRYASFRGTAASDVRATDWGWSLEASLDHVEHAGGAWPVDLRAWVSGGGELPRLEPGERLAGDGRLESVGRGGFAEYLASRGIDLEVRASGLEVGRGGASPPMAAANATRLLLRSGAMRGLRPDRAGLLLGLAVGDTSSLDPEVERDFRASGLGHLLAVSGSNVATFLVPVLALATRARARPRSRVAIGIAAVVFFALVTRWEPSVLRASVMAAIALVALGAGRPRSTGSALAASVIALLLLDPALARSIGFQLSVAATAGIAALAGPISARLRGLPRHLALAVAATLGAQAAVTPLLLLHFGVVPMTTLLANVLAFPAVAPALLLGVSAASVALVSEHLGRTLGSVAEVPLDYLAAVADLSARFPLPSVTAEGLAVPLVSALLVAVATWRLRHGRRPVGAVLALIALASAAWSAPAGDRADTLTATFFDVGQGDAALVRGPAGETILVDAGPDEEQVAIDLARLGVRRIDLAVASHAHADHVAGFPSILARFPVSLVLDPGCPGDSPVYADYLEAVRDEGVRVEHPRGGDGFTVGTLTVEVLGPDRCSPIDEPNDDSIVLRVRLGEDSILFPGDAEVGAQQDLLEDRDPIAADVLKVPHHAGDTSDAGFLQATHAAVAVVSTGRNTYGHPHPAVLETLRGAGMMVLRTDRRGDITLWFTPRGDVVVGSGS